MTSSLTTGRILRRVRVMLGVLIAGLVISGATAIPIETQLDLAARWFRLEGTTETAPEGSLRGWLARVHAGVKEVQARHPFVAYGTDWLAFGHFAIAILFASAWQDPVRSMPLLRAGVVVCVAVVPYALVLGGIRGVPWFWRLIDGAFGLAGLVPLALSLRWLGEYQRRGGVPGGAVS